MILTIFTAIFLPVISALTVWAYKQPKAADGFIKMALPYIFSVAFAVAAFSIGYKKALADVAHYQNNRPAIDSIDDQLTMYSFLGFVFAGLVLAVSFLTIYFEKHSTDKGDSSK